MIWHPDWAGVLSGQPLAWIGTGFVTTLLVTLVGSLLTTVILLLLALRMMPGRSGRLLVAGWVSLFRNTPLLVQLFFWYFAAWSALPVGWRDYLADDHRWATLPGNLPWLTPEFICAAWGLAVFSAAYLLEELQAGLNALSAGQREAAIAQGFSRLAMLRYILLPQGVRNAWQPLVGQYLNLMKLSSLASAIGFGELTYYISQIESYNAHALEGVAVGTALYLLLGLAMGAILLRLGPRPPAHGAREAGHEL
ncbi:polar amino acid ABC transporter inner membrane subunit [Candidatus Sodalis pierantonius str. SOPE]|uniref:Polar amino acid ABC transporter inner membrane subunit n=1 Tax=Candidatus Sodalis pierantonii str. SOPE TaxID=2342 RepID=K7T2M6_9GAMM|nr:amino acid ABC transporter permease [Candidatus Sodalis pierantonius]AFW03712.1 polar amino acid ABC transporter inner membrane subunit [Candidatus Sodalis pierantonius str. SOPE]AHF73106.1 polar amino acid ABC transporter inner membrane subunit [Candidatus Sodalis pierantonius str. SOPE]